MKIARVVGGALAGACLVVGGAAAGEFDDGSFAMPLEVVSAATAFQTYMAGAARIGGGFSNGDGGKATKRRSAARR